MRFLQYIFGVSGLLVPQLETPSVAGEPVVPTDHPAGIQFSTWLAAHNSGDKETITRYHEVNFTEAAGLPVFSVENDFSMQQFSGGFDVVEVLNSSVPSSITVLLKGKKWASYLRAEMSVDVSKDNLPATRFFFKPGNIPLHLVPNDDPRRKAYEKGLQPLTPALREAVVQELTGIIQREYIDVEIGATIVSTLQESMQNGTFDNITNSQDFSIELFSTLHRLNHTAGVFIAFSDPLIGTESGDAAELESPRKLFEELQERNFHFDKNISFDTSSLPGRTIATLPINSFAPTNPEYASDSEQILAAVGEIVSSVGSADAVIIDLRGNHGGDSNTVAFILSYFLYDGSPNGRHLTDFIDNSGKVNRSMYTTPLELLPGGTEPLGTSKPVFVLTSNTTFGAGEDMAYNLQAFKRATIIGEGNNATTGFGSANPSVKYICEEEFGKRWWMAGVPSLRAVHSVTGVSWKGVGVESDVIAGQGDWKDTTDAHEVARRLAVIELQGRDEL
ncbi:hypothetical protein B7463_g12270, partial [Scytalidium lignicola]